jgi:hypothetical protein
MFKSHGAKDVRHASAQLQGSFTRQLVVLAFIILVAALSNSRAGVGQDTRDQSDMTIDTAMRLEVIEGVLKNLKEHYAYPDAADQMEKAIRERLRKREYDRITSAITLAKVLTAHLQEVREDPHLRVEFTARPGSSTSDTATTVQTPEEQQAQRESWLRYGTSRNFFIDKADRLGGNVGYLKMSAFFFLDMTKDTLAAAMSFLAYTDALIVDLRNCGGGDVAMTELFVDYFFDGAGSTGLAGKRYLGRDVYVLTSKEIYSAPEGVARALQSKKRAFIVGEVTRGATNITAGFPINRFFSVSVPYTRETGNTGTDLTRQGVKPDVEVLADRALDTAYLAALKKLLGKDADGEIAEERKKMIEVLQRRLR